MALNKCPLCKGDVPDYNLLLSPVGQVNCHNCGTFQVSPEYGEDGLSSYGASDRALISGRIKELWRRGASTIFLSPMSVDENLRTLPRLKPPEKANRLLLLLERLTPSLGTHVKQEDVTAADAYAESPEELSAYISWLSSRGYLQRSGWGLVLTMEGWTEGEKIRLQREVAGNRAFMAMKFGDIALDALVADHYVPAVKAAGFDLRRLDQGQAAGLIDDQLRTRIRTARFMVSDITHGNNGTYWEAGFAEGLGRPVIYSCERTAFDGLDKSKRAHFDTNHLVTVLWDPKNPADAARRLKDIVRETFPEEAILED